MLRFVTEYTKDGKRYAGFIDAVDLEHAQRIAEAMVPPEKVVGTLHAVVKALHWTSDDANAFTEALANENSEPPKAEEFSKAMESDSEN